MLMFPFVGINVGGDSSVLKSSLDSGGTYIGTDTEPLGALSGFCSLTILTDGTWTVTVGSDDDLTGTPINGYWVLGGAPITGVGTDHEVIFTHDGVTGTGSISNGASSYSALTSNRVFTFNANSGQNGNTNCTVTIRKIGTTTPVCTEVIQIGATGS